MCRILSANEHSLGTIFEGDIQEVAVRESCQAHYQRKDRVFSDQNSGQLPIRRRQIAHQQKWNQDYSNAGQCHEDLASTRILETAKVMTVSD